MSPILQRTTTVDPKIYRINDDEGLHKSYLWTFGDNSFGQLLTETLCGVVEPTPQSISRINKHTIALLSCGAQNTFVIANNGDLWGGGYNENGQLTQATDDDTVEHSSTVPRLCYLEKFAHRRIHNVAAADQNVIVVFDNGSAVSYGTNEYGQLGQGEKSVSLISREPGAVVSLTHRGGVSQVECGPTFTLFLTCWGEVWSCGSNGSGCLGNPDVESRYEITQVLKFCRSASPIRIPGLAGTPIVQIAVGEEHCLALSLTGRLFVWGKSSNGQLGLGNEAAEEKIIFSPRLVPASDLERRPKKIAAGGAHSIIIMAGGIVATAGLNSSGQCGFPVISENMNLWKFSILHSLPVDLRWLMAAGGHAHSVLVSASGEVYTFGRNTEGQLGLGKLTSYESEPQKVYLPLALGPDAIMFAYGCATGNYHTAIASAPITVDPAQINNFAKQMSGVKAPLRRSSTLISFSADSLPFFKKVSDVRPTKPVKKIMTTQPHILKQILVSPADNIKRLPSLEWRIASSSSIPSPKRWCAVYTATELMDLFKTSSQDKAEMSLFRTELNTLFSNCTRLNCSFLLNSRTGEVDVQGISNFYNLIVGTDELQHSETLALLIRAMDQCLDDILPFAKYFITIDQIKFVLIMLQCPAFGLYPLPSFVGNCLAKIYRLIPLLPCQGRQHIFEIITNSYPSAQFQNSLVRPARQHVEFILPRHIGRSLPDVEELWDVIMFLQLCFWSNETTASQPRLDETTKRLGKIPREEFWVKFPESGRIDPAAEYQVLVRSAVESRKLNLPGSADETVKRYGDNPRLYNDNDCPWRFSPQHVLIKEGPIQNHLRYFLAHTNLLPITFKRDVVRCQAVIRQTLAQKRALESAIMSGLNVVQPYLNLVVNRGSLIRDAMKQLSNIQHGFQLLKPLKVIFEGEEGVDEGGLKREFFSLAVEQLFSASYGMFSYDEGSRCAWFTSCPIDDQIPDYALVGVLLGLALYNDVQLDLKLAPAVYKKLQKENLDLEDYGEVNRSKAQSLKLLLAFETDTLEQRQEFEYLFGMINFVETVEFYGSRKEIPLKANGEDIYITVENRIEYVNLVIDYYLNRAITASFKQFDEGFTLLSDSDLLQTLTSNELQLLLNGYPDANFQELRDGATYEGGYHNDDPYIEDFWRIVEKWDVLKKQRFLHFCTGSHRSPVGGLRELHLKIQKNGSEPIDRLPTAYTCYNIFLLPRYADAEKLERLLTMAVELGEGFGLR